MHTSVISCRCLIRNYSCLSTITGGRINTTSKRTLHVDRSVDNVDLNSFEEENASTDQAQKLLKHPYQSLFPWKSKFEFAEYLTGQIVHKDDGLVVVNKPFGVGVVNSKANAKSKGSFHTNHLRGIGITDYSLEGVLPILREALNKPELVLVKGTERMTSGISVFADNLKQAEKFSNKLRISKGLSNMLKPLYTYQVITAATPFTNETTIQERVGIHLKSTPLSDNMQPVIERKFSKSSMKKGDIKVVRVHTNIMRLGDHKTALLEIQTSSIKWNFLRVYCSDLLTPILGDHLYSCRVQSIMGIPTKIDVSHALPGSSDQKLSCNLLNALQVKESIEVPPHMHLQSYSLHNYRGKGLHLELKAPLPEYFEWTKQMLHLS